MKIAILSLPPGHNYGGILQSYALKTVLEREGNEVSVLTKKYKPQPFTIDLLPRYLVRIYRKIFKGSHIRINAEKHQLEDRQFILQETLRFCNRYLNLRELDSFEDIKPTDYDMFVVGSDQVWRPKYFEDLFDDSISNAYLSFARDWNIKRISVAASFGVDNWEYSPKITAECKDLISLFDKVSVREQSAIGLCKDNFGIDSELVCDPTMLLTRDEYLSLIPADAPKSPENLLVYCLDGNNKFDELVQRIATEKNLIPFSTINKKTENYPLSERVMPSVESWIQGFEDAEFVITDSFHACVFSLIFNKPFVVVGNKRRGMTRIESLLNEFGISNRLLYDPVSYHGLAGQLNDVFINNKLEEERCKFHSIFKEFL